MIKFLVITDGKLSGINQCSAVVNELKKIMKKKIIIKYFQADFRFLKILPNFLIYYLLRIENFFFRNYKQKSDFIISCGRIAAPLNLIFKRNNHDCKNCHILNPYFKLDDFDKIIIPEHDLNGKNKRDNFIATFGTLVDKTKIFKKNSNLLKYIPSKKKIISVLIGGDGRSSKIKNNELADVIKELNSLSKKFSIVYCFSRRTSINLIAFIKKNANDDCLFFPNKAYNPYWDILSVSCHLFVTGDSISMVSDCLTSGKPTYIIPIQNVKKKIKKFINLTIKKGLARIFKNNLENWRYIKLSEVDRVCINLKKILDF